MLGVNGNAAGELKLFKSSVHTSRCLTEVEKENNKKKQSSVPQRIKQR